MSLQPFCDGSHEGTNFNPVSFVATDWMYFCACKQTAMPPYCDGRCLFLLSLFVSSFIWRLRTTNIRTLCCAQSDYSGFIAPFILMSLHLIFTLFTDDPGPRVQSLEFNISVSMPSGCVTFHASVSRSVIVGVCRHDRLPRNATGRAFPPNCVP